MRRFLFILLFTCLSITQAQSKIFLYVIANNETPYEVMFLKDVKRESTFWGSYESDGRAYDKIEEVIADYEGHDIALVEVNYSEMVRHASDSFETISNLAKYLCTQIAKHKKDIHCFLTLNCWIGKNTIHLLTQMLDAQIKEITVTEYLKDVGKTREKKLPKSALQWPARRYNLSDTINKIFWVNLLLPESGEDYPLDTDIIAIKCNQNILQFNRSMIFPSKSFWNRFCSACPCTSCLSSLWPDTDDIIIKMAKRGVQTLMNRALSRNNLKQKLRSKKS